MVVVRLLGILFVVTGFGEAVEAVTGHRQGSYWGLLLLRGAVNLALGLAMIFWPGVTVTVAVWLLGVDLLLTGVLGLHRGHPGPQGDGPAGPSCCAVWSPSRSAWSSWCGPT